MEEHTNILPIGLGAYHGSTYLFDKFEIGRPSACKQPGTELGIHLTLTKGSAIQYAMSYPQEYYDNPLDVNVKKELDINHKGYLYHVTLTGGKYMDIKFPEIGLGPSRINHLMKAMKDNYDFIIVRDSDIGVGGIVDEVVVFNTEIIKINEIEEL